MELFLAFVGQAEEIASQHEGTRFFDATGVTPAVGDFVAVTFLPAGTRAVFQCVSRTWDLSQMGKTVLHVELDFPDL